MKICDFTTINAYFNLIKSEQQTKRWGIHLWKVPDQPTSISVDEIATF